MDEILRAIKKVNLDASQGKLDIDSLDANIFSSYLDTKDLKSIAQQLDIMLSDYEIESRKTDIITYEYQIPKSVEVYIVSKKNSWSFYQKD